MDKMLDQFLGCLIGGAVGDALGYSIEFLDERTIFRKYGKRGITRYDLSSGKAIVSDDTQMSLFTANGLLNVATQNQRSGLNLSYRAGIRLAYQDWYRTQMAPLRNPIHEVGNTWIFQAPVLHYWRAPGGTCLNALERGGYGRVDQPINCSKGCGGVMRVAPIGLYFYESLPKAMQVGAEAAALTHGHELGYLPAAMLSYMVGYLVQDSNHTIKQAALKALDEMDTLFFQAFHLQEFKDLMSQAISLSTSNLPDLEAIHELGEGWVGEEALAIALYCALKHADDFEQGIVAAVNHKGDSDSTGAIAGNILGAHLGLQAIPSYFVEDLDVKELLFELGYDLYEGLPKKEEDKSIREKAWNHKYLFHDYLDTLASSSMPTIKK